MPSIGSVRSVAIAGGEGSPTFEAIKQSKKISAKVDKTAEKLAAQDKQIADLSAALAKLLAAQGITDDEPAKELTSAEKAAKTRAENKAKAEDEAE